MTVQNLPIACLIALVLGAPLSSNPSGTTFLDASSELLISCPIEPLILCVDDPNVYLPANNQVLVGLSHPDATSCGVHVMLGHVVTDSCGGEVTYDVRLYLNDGADALQVITPMIMPLDTNNTVSLVFSSEFSTLPADHPIRVGGIPYNDVVCSNWPGTGGEKDYHRVEWRVIDGCGQLTECSYLFRLEDCRAPKPTCIGLSSVVLSSFGPTTLSAQDFISEGIDDCTESDNFSYSFSGVAYEPNQDFWCDDIENNGSNSFALEIWLADGGRDVNCNGVIDPLGIEWSERARDFCVAFVVLDGDGVCHDPSTGRVTTEDQRPVEMVNVTLRNQDGDILSASVTDTTGFYILPFLNPLLDYALFAERNDNHKNGVSTIDMVRVQKHLLGVEALSSPYQLIAADANNSESISALDLLDMRKLILGIATEFPNNQSWRFVDKQFVFSDSTNPWPFNAFIEYRPFEPNDFIGMKIGDVNGTAIANASGHPDLRSPNDLNLSIADRFVLAGQSIHVDVHHDSSIALIGLQGTFETDGLLFEQVIARAVDVHAEHIAVHKNAVALAWFDIDPDDQDEPLFTFHFTATKDGLLSEMLSLSSRITEAEAYDMDENVFEVAFAFTDPTQQSVQYQCPDDPLVLCVNDSTVYLPENNQIFIGEAHPDATSCSAHVMLNHEVTNICGGQVTYDVRLYLDDGPDPLQVQTPRTMSLDSNGTASLAFSSEFSTLPADHPIRVGGLPYNDKVCSNWPAPGGDKDYHRIEWRVITGCGSLTRCSYLIRLEDCQAPVVSCKTLSHMVIPSSGTVVLRAVDLVTGTDDCGLPDQLLYSFSDSTFVPTRFIDCETVDCHGPYFEFDIWVADLGQDEDCNGQSHADVHAWHSRNKMKCMTTTRIMDDKGVCFTEAAFIYGEIETRDYEPVPGVTVGQLSESGELLRSWITSADGFYWLISSHCEPIPMYQIVPSLNADHKNGVSTLDVIKVLKHLNGLENLPTPYDIIAADVNNDERLSPLDLVHMRRLIVGLDKEFKFSQSWRFIPSRFNFADSLNPWPIEESVQTYHGNYDFVAIKIGDVNGTVDVHQNHTSTNIAQLQLNLFVENQSVSKGEQVNVKLLSQDRDSILGLQMTLELDGMNFVDVTSNSLNVTSDFVGLHPYAVALAWCDVEPKATSDTLFTLHFTATKDGLLSEMLSLSSRITEAEAYDMDENVMDLSLRFATADMDHSLPTPAISLLQNAPNPFSENTTIQYLVPTGMPYTLTVHDLNGKIVYEKNGLGQQRTESITLDASHLPGKGVFIYRLRAGADVQAKKMILL